MLLWSNFPPPPAWFLGVLHRIPWKDKNTVYRLKISVIVQSIFKFAKCVKYANEMTDDVTQSTQFYIKHINRAILINLQHRPLKVGGLIVLQEIHLRLEKSCSHENSLFSCPHLLYRLKLKIMISTFFARNVGEDCNNERSGEKRNWCSLCDSVTQ